MDLKNAFTFWRKRSPKFLREVASTHLRAYCGVVPRLSSVHFCVYAIALDQQQTLALLGTRTVGRYSPTHSLFCTQTLSRDKGKVRILFNVYLGLSDIPALFQDAIAIGCCDHLKAHLMQCQAIEVLVAQKYPHELPWHQTPESLAQYWVIEAAIAYKEQIARLRKKGIVR